MIYEDSDLLAPLGDVNLYVVASNPEVVGYSAGAALVIKEPVVLDAEGIFHRVIAHTDHPSLVAYLRHMPRHSMHQLRLRRHHRLVVSCRRYACPQMHNGWMVMFYVQKFGQPSTDWSHRRALHTSSIHDVCEPTSDVRSHGSASLQYPRCGMPRRWVGVDRLLQSCSGSLQLVAGRPKGILDFVDPSFGSVHGIASGGLYFVHPIHSFNVAASSTLRINSSAPSEYVCSTLPR